MFDVAKVGIISDTAKRFAENLHYFPFGLSPAVHAALPSGATGSSLFGGRGARLVLSVSGV